MNSSRARHIQNQRVDVDAVQSSSLQAGIPAADIEASRPDISSQKDDATLHQIPQRQDQTTALTQEPHDNPQEIHQLDSSWSEIPNDVWNGIRNLLTPSATSLSFVVEDHHHLDQ